MSGEPRGLRLRSDAVLLAVAFAGVGALWLRFNVAPPGVGRPFPHDLVYYFLPQLDRVGQRLSSLELPLWNPDPCTGLPLLASLQVAVFYPTTWLSALLPADLVLSIVVFVHLLLGGASCAYLFRGWGLSSGLAGAFGVVFVFACLLGQSFWPPEVVTISWLPFLWLCSERVMSAPRADGWWLALVGAAALQILAGFPQFVVYGLQLLIPVVLVRAGMQWAADASPRPAVAAGTRLAAGLLLGLGIAAVQLAPTFEVLSESHRARRFSEQEVHYLQKEARLPTLLANAARPEPRLTSYELGRGAGYLGVGTLVLAGVALVGRRRDPVVWLLAGSGCAWLVLSDGYLGVASDLYRAYAMLPGIGLFRAPERLLFPAFLCFIALAALGARTVERAAEGSRGDRIAIAVAAAALAGLFAFAGSAGAAWRGVVALGWVTGALLLSRTPGASGVSGWERGWRGAGALLLVADVVAATAAHGSLRDLPDERARLMRAGRHEILSAAELARVRDRAGRGRVELFAPGMQIRPVMGIGEAGGLHRLACYETLLPGQWPALSKLAGSPDYPSAVMSNVDPDRMSAVFDAASVTTVVRVQPGPRPGRPRIEISENPDALPRAYLVGSFEVVGRDAALERLARGDVRLQRQVLVDADPGLEPSPATRRAIPADIVSLEPERVEIAARSPGDALLVLTDTDAPGWSASVNGEPAEILRANGLFRAVRVPPGESQVVFRYAPTSLRAGAAVSALCALIAAAAWLRARSR